MTRRAQDYAADVAALNPIAVRGSRGKFVVLLVVSLGFVAAGIWLLGHPDVSRWAMWILIGFSALFAVVFAALIIRPNTLSLDREGFRVQVLMGDVPKERWRDTDDFRMQRTGPVTQLLYTVSRPPRGKIEAASLAAMGNRAGVAGVYTLSGRELAALLQLYRNAAVEAAKA